MLRQGYLSSVNQKEWNLEMRSIADDGVKDLPVSLLNGHDCPKIKNIESNDRRSPCRHRNDVSRVNPPGTRPVSAKCHQLELNTLNKFVVFIVSK